MANPKIKHSLIPELSLHDNKGVSSAENGASPTASSGATVWKKVEGVNVLPVLEPLGNRMLHMRYQLSSGTRGGMNNYEQEVSTFVKFNPPDRLPTIPLNTVVVNEIDGASLDTSSSHIGTFTLPEGKYFIKSRNVFMCGLGDNSQPVRSPPVALLARDNAGSTILVLSGTVGKNWYIPIYWKESVITGYFSAGASTDFRITTFSDDTLSGRKSDGWVSRYNYYMSETLGKALDTGEDEVYSDVIIWKLD